MYKPIDMESLKLNNNFKWVITKDDFFSKEANNEKTSDLFYKKTFYEGTFVSEYSNLTNFNFGEKLVRESKSQIYTI